MQLVILIGLQASGKSTFRRTRFDATHVVVSKDEFPHHRRPAQRQEQLVRAALGQGNRVVVDNTNARLEDREALIRLAREYSVPVAGYFLRSTIADSLGRNARRPGRARVPDVALYRTAKILVEPAWSEGFDELYEVTIGPGGEFLVRPWPARP